jgi:hypothetical protein
MQQRVAGRARKNHTHREPNMISLIKISLLPAATLFVVLAGLEKAHAGDEPDHRMGYFEGIVKSKQAGDLDVTLNLR